jgi:glycosyltransferase involved in cell wall biosynthesis
MNVYTPINNLGYGVVGINVTKELSKITDVALFPIGQIDWKLEDEDIISLTNLINKPYSASHDCLKIWHEHSLAERIGSGEFGAYVFFEIDTFDDRRKKHVESTDVLFVASKWAKNVVLSNTDLSSSDVFVAPCGVDTDVFYHIPNRMKNEKCIFFTCGKWEYRKGHDIIIEAFNRAFDSNEDVELRMMCDNPFLNPTESRYWTNKYLDDRISLIGRVDNQSTLAFIMGQADCGIFPSRAEGWNLELLEMMACGRHCIATNYSAHTEFCNSENCMLIDIDEKEKAFDGKFFHGLGEWAKLGENQIDHLSFYLKDFYRKWLDNEDLVNYNGIETAKKFSWAKTASIIKGGFEHYCID